MLTVTVAGERVALAGRAVAEIVRPRNVTRVPNGPASLLGLANVRGAVLPVVSFAMLLGLPQWPQSPASRVVIVDGGTPVGLLVDAVSTLAPAVGEQEVDLQPLLARAFSGLALRGGGAGLAVAGTHMAASAEPDMLSLIGFIVHEQEFALPLDAVIEVAAVTADPTDIPHTGPAMMGVMAFRGGLLPLVSLRALLGLPRDGFDRRKSRAIVVRVGATDVGLVADAVSSVLRVAAEAIDTVPAVLTRGAAETQIAAICRLDDGRRLVCILSPDRLFDAETTVQLLDSAEQAAEPAALRQAQHATTDQFVVFHLGEERYGLPISAVRAVVRRPAGLSRVPHAPAFVEGVMNLRGRLVPVINQRERFGARGQAPAQGRRVVVVAVDGLEAGLAVDAVSELVALSPSDRSAMPALNDDGGKLIDRVALAGGDGPMILLLDATVLLSQTERDAVAAMADKPRLVAAF